MDKVNLERAFSRFHDYWNPKVAAELNGQHVKLVKLKGEFVWHHHEHEDELFLVVKGSLDIQFRQGSVTLNEEEFLIVPRMVEHRPVAREKAHVLLFEPTSTLNTGNVRSDRTVESPQVLK